MRTKEWLGQYLELERECGYIQEQIAIKERRIPEAVDSAFKKSLEMTRKMLADQLVRLQKVEMEILSSIEKVEESRLRLLLRLRYIEGLHWEEVAERLSYDYFYTIKKLHPAALREVEAIRKRTEQ